MSLEYRRLTRELQKHRITPSPTNRPPVDSNTRGRHSEEHVASVLTKLPEIKDVKISELNSRDEKRLADLIVFFAPINGVKEKPVKVQVKSGDHGKSHFYKTVGHRLRSEGKGLDTPENRDDYVHRNRLVYINGGDVTEGIIHTENGEKQKVKRPVRDEEIVENFWSQAHAIFEYANSPKTPQQPH